MAVAQEIPPQDGDSDSSCESPEDETDEDVASDTDTDTDFVPDPNKAYISGLPPEILGQIFILYVQEVFSRTWVDPGLPLPQTTLLTVSRHWSLVASSTPELWGYIFVTTPAVLPPFIARSKHAPLHVTALVNFRAENAGRVVRALTPHVDRIRELRLRMGKNTGLAAVNDVMAGWVAPALTAFHPRLSAGFWLGVSWTPVVAPALRCLKLTNVQVDWARWRAYPALDTLVVKQGAGAAGLGTMADLLAALDAMPALRRLVLWYVLPPTLGDVADAVQGRLRALEELDVLSTAPLPSAWLLRHTSVPPDIGFFVRTFGPDGLEDVRDAVAAHAGRCVPARFLAVHLGLSEFNFTLAPAALDLVDGYTARAGQPLPPSRISVAAYDNSRRPHMHVHAHGQLTLRALLPSLADIRHLDVELSSADRRSPVVWDALRVEDPEAVPLPRLRHVSLSYTDLSHRKSFDALVDWLIERCNYGVPVERLSLGWRCCLNKEKCARLAELVPHIENVCSDVSDVETDASTSDESSGPSDPEEAEDSQEEEEEEEESDTSDVGSLASDET